MLSLDTRLALALAVVGVAQSATLARRQTIVPGQCAIQSCELATLSGSDGKPYVAQSPPQDLAEDGYCCILNYNPQPRDLLYQQMPELQQLCAYSSSLFGTYSPYVFERDPAAAVAADEAGSAEKRQTQCAPKTLIFARGTGDATGIGTNVGPALQDGLDAAEPGQWAVMGVEYNADEAGNDCVGLPGGASAAALLDQVASSCPDSQIVMSGYSQGAMVARNGVAYSNQVANPKLKGVVTFGDPFNGAQIEGYDGPMDIYCKTDDLVCGGRRIITAAHGEYVGDDTTDAVQKMIGLTA